MEQATWYRCLECGAVNEGYGIRETCIDCHRKYSVEKTTVFIIRR